MATTHLNEAQIQILDMMSHIKSQESLERLKSQIAEFYAKLIDEEMDALWKSGEMNEEKLSSFENAHFRTPYK